MPADTMELRVCKLTGPITDADWAANGSPVADAAKTYLAGLVWTAATVIENNLTNKPIFKWVATNSMSGGYHKTGVSRNMSDGEVKVQFDHADTPNFKAGELRGLTLFLDLNGDGAPCFEAGGGNVPNIIFYGVMRIGEKPWAIPQEGIITISLKLESDGWCVLDLI